MERIRGFWARRPSPEKGGGSAGGQRKNLVEMLTFHPELKFARSVAGVFAALEHGDHDDFDSNRSSRRRGLGGEIARIDRGQREREDQPLRKTAREISACCAMSEVRL